MVNARLLAPADLPPAATPLAVDLSAPATPAAVALPSAPSPAFVELPTAASSVVAEPQASIVTWFSRMFAEFSGGVWMQGTGLSVNDAAPKQEFGGSGFALRAGTLLTRVALPFGWTYETAVFLQGEANLYDNAFNIFGIGGGISPQFIYPISHDCALVLSPDVMAGAGILWSKTPVDVGIPDKVYWASESYTFPELAAGFGVYLDMHTSYKNLSFTTGIHGGGRWYWHQDAVSNLPAGMPSGSTVSLASPMWDVLKLAFGFRF